LYPQEKKGASEREKRALGEDSAGENLGKAKQEGAPDSRKAKVSVVGEGPNLNFYRKKKTDQKSVSSKKGGVYKEKPAWDGFKSCPA